MRRNPASSTLEIYKLQIKVFENGQPEELIALLKKFKKAIGGTGTTTITGLISYLRIMLHGEALWAFYNM